MGRVHPNHAFLAEGLYSVSHVCQSSRMGYLTALRTSCISSMSDACDVRRVFTATSTPLNLPLRISANPLFAIMAFSTLNLWNILTR